MTSLAIVTNTSEPINVTSVAMLVCLEINSWTARKHDRNISNSVARQAGTDETAGRYNKQLIPKHALSKILSLIHI